MRFISASAAPRPAFAARRGAPRRTRRAAPPRRAARATVRARGDDAASPETGDPNERLREELRRSLRAEADGVEAERRNRPSFDDKEMSSKEMSDDIERSGVGGANSRRRYAITVRELEIFRYTLPDFFPDFNETPLEARKNAGLDDDLLLSSDKSSERKETSSSRPYVWRRGVLAGVERSDPLDVIARERERFERELAKTNDDDDDDEASEASSSRLVSEASSSEKRRAIPPPPRREGAEEELGIVSKALLGLTLFFYLVALFVTTSRAFLGDSQPAPINSESGALATRTPAAVPESIRGTRAGEMWQEKLGGTGGDVIV